MNENPGGTPNPLNPTPLDANPSEPMGETPVNEAPVRPDPVQPDPVQPEPVQPEPVPEPATQPLTEELVEESVHVSSLDPEGRPMEKAPAVDAQAAAPKKKKTGLIVGLVICLFIAVGCGVAAILMLMNSSKDPVSAAVSKLMSGDVPANVGISGVIEVSATDEESPITSATINLDSQLKTGSMINATTADVVITSADANEYSFKLSEVYANTEDLYLKVEKKEEMLQVEDEEKLEETNCVDDESGMTNCGGEVEVVTEEGEEDVYYGDELTSTLDSIIGMIDGEWLKLDLSTSGWITGGLTENSELTCVIDAVEEMGTNSNSLAEVYNKNPFISSATENIPVNSKLNQLRQITINDEKFVSFINTLQTTPLATAINECTGEEEATQITLEDVDEMISKLPAIYAEVNPDNTFSRLYTVIMSEDGDYTIKVDLSFTYPTNINVSEPVEYTDFNEFIQNLFNYDNYDYDYEDEEAVEEDEKTDIEE